MFEVFLLPSSPILETLAGYESGSSLPPLFARFWWWLVEDVGRETGDVDRRSMGERERSLPEEELCPLLDDVANT